MYIRRDSLKDVGLFDVENFGKGYGEENDFCQRAEDAGWRNLHLLDTFVLHTGGVSFGDSKSPRERAAMEKLARLHPNYAHDVHRFVQADPARPYRLALDLARIRDAGLPVILTVLHDRAGGTVRHVRELAEHLSDKAVFLILTPYANKCVALRMAGENEGFELTFKIAEQFEDLLNVLRQLHVSHVHYHHLLGHDKHVRDIPALLNVSYDFTAHDFYSYCTYITITGEENRYQGEISPGQCKCCTPDMPAPLEGNVARWRGANARFLSAARTVLTPSRDTARRIIGFAPAANVHAVQHTDIDTSVPLPDPSPQPIKDDRPLRIVVLGALSAIKGADVLETVAIEAARQDAPVEFHLLGYGYRHLLSQPKAALSVHGAYKEEDLPRLLAWLKPDLIWFPAQWPETYSYTLSAALQAGLPVVVPDIGPLRNAWSIAHGPGFTTGIATPGNGSTSSNRCAKRTSFRPLHRFSIWHSPTRPMRSKRPTPSAGPIRTTTSATCPHRRNRPKTARRSSVTTYCSSCPSAHTAARRRRAFSACWSTCARSRC
ncbi:glycosyltransferase [Diaphorobacter aerolatus]|uniref:glycosyltransferase n=1 Tax=Diaphorobacter aerolatus TaxID=1288495 RepID=UPI001D0047F9|nr:hypothetical protein [Diaphorobacter aerolatus]